MKTSYVKKILEFSLFFLTFKQNSSLDLGNLKTLNQFLYFFKLLQETREVENYFQTRENLLTKKVKCHSYFMSY